MGQRKKFVDVAEVERLAARGLTEGQIAKQLGVSPDTMTARKVDQEGVVEAIAAGRRRAIGVVENVAFEAALKAKEDHRFQTSAIFWLKCNAGWKEHQVVEVKDEREQVRRRDLLDRVNMLANRGTAPPDVPAA
ncbi:MAG: hypothetical protein AAGJ10_16675 [Bacteroidota bacterium]